MKRIIIRRKPEKERNKKKEIRKEEKSKAQQIHLN
jgi:hypothetical protein